MSDTASYFSRENQEDLAQVNNIIQEQVTSDVALINQIGFYIVNAGGKRLRPLTVILAGKALGYNAEMLYRQAAMVEFIHTSTLLHDDVVDESDLRRGRQTANRLFGNAAAVLVGDFLYTRAFQLMVTADSMKIMQIMAEATNIIAAGEVMQLINIGNIALSEADYLEIIENKTAKLFQAAARVGAVLAGAKPEEEEALAAFGRLLGLTFQIVDDILDYSGNTEDIGKNIGDDLKEGKLTLPLIYLTEHGTDSQSQMVRNILEHPDATDFTRIYQEIIASRALDYCYAVATRLAKEAAAALTALKPNVYTETLCRLVLDSVKRHN